MRSLYGCLRIPDFAVAIRVRGERQPPPTIVIRGEAPNQFVYAGNEGAQRRGVREGMPLAEAQMYFQSVGEGGLRALEHDPAAERRVQRELLELASTVSPRFEDAGPGLVVLDLAGLPDPHESAARLFAGAQEMGLPAHVAVSCNRVVAVCAARTMPGVTHVYPGQEAGFLEAQPLDAFPLEEAERETLTRWGIRTAGELARFSESDLAARFGARGTHLVRLARGEESSVLHAYAPPPQFEERRDLDWEMGELEPLAFVLSELLDRLCEKLRAHNQAASSIETSLRLAGGRTFERKVDLAYPLTDPHTLLTLIRLDLAAHRPGDAVVGVGVMARPVEQRRMQMGLFTPEAPSPEKMATTLARLRSLVGEQRVGAPVALDTHRPGAAAVETFAVSAGSEAMDEIPPLPPAAQPVSRHAIAERLRLALRVFRPPWPARIVLRGGRPVHADAGSVCGPVTTQSGPWTVAGEWWTEDGWEYEEWDVEIEAKLYRICRERRSGDWLVTGEYD